MLIIVYLVLDFCTLINFIFVSYFVSYLPKNRCNILKIAVINNKCLHAQTLKKQGIAAVIGFAQKQHRIFNECFQKAIIRMVKGLY